MAASPADAQRHEMRIGVGVGGIQGWESHDESGLDGKDCGLGASGINRAPRQSRTSTFSPSGSIFLTSFFHYLPLASLHTHPAVWMCASCYTSTRG
jgi:hypothetical protein